MDARNDGAKRALDLALSVPLWLLSLPIQGVFALTIRLTMGSPVLFRQTRPGLHGEPFELVKFRTMRPPKAGQEPFTTDDVRVTRLGEVLRRTSLDELPELLQVLTGKMSLVGPRPLVMEYLPRYSARHARRHEVKPGITGLAQVSGRRSLTFGQRLDLDVEYVETWSLRLDVQILLRTLSVPFQRGDIKGQSIAEVDDVNLFHRKLRDLG